MKKVFVLMLAIAGLSAFAGTCVFQNTKLSEINGNKVFAGELLNDSGANFLNHKVKVAFLTGDNQIVDTVSVDGCLRSWQNGELAFFSASTSKGDPEDIEKTLQRLDTFTVGDVVSGDINITNVEANRNGDTLTVTGTVKNVEGDDLDDVRVCIVVRDDSGDVLTVKRDDNTYDLNDDESQTFSVTIDVIDDTDDTATVDVWVDALNGGDPTEPQSELDWDVEECAAATATPATATNTPEPTITPAPTNTPVPGC